MSTASIQYVSSLFQSFKEIEPDGYRSILRFVEDHSTDISMLPVQEYFALQYAYAAALFETGGYQRVVALSDELLELSIVHSLQEVDGEDAYRALLYRRASSLLHLMRYDECIYVCDQLLRLHPTFTAAGILYEKALYQRPNALITRGRALSVVLFLLAASLIAFEVLVAEYFFGDRLDPYLGYVRNGSLFLGWSLLLFGDIAHRGFAWWRVRLRKVRYATRRHVRKD